MTDLAGLRIGDSASLRLCPHGPQPEAFLENITSEQRETRSFRSAPTRRHESLFANALQYVDVFA
jgi:hypothetical protein